MDVNNVGKDSSGSHTSLGIGKLTQKINPINVNNVEKCSPESHISLSIGKCTQEKKMLCEQCGETFSSKEYLAVHKRTHTGEM